jgi:hypothetical protein
MKITDRFLASGWGRIELQNDEGCDARIDEQGDIAGNKI